MSQPRDVLPGPARRSTTARLGALAVVVALSGCQSGTVLFSADDESGTGISDFIQEKLLTADSTVELAMYTFTSIPLRDALIRTADRGVTVRICLDRSDDNAGINAEVALGLQNSSVQLKQGLSFAGEKIHHKFLVIDETSLMTGSFNFTDSADMRNDENLLYVVDPVIAGQYTAAFNELWERCE